MSQPRSKEHLAALTGVRALAAAWVLWLHAGRMLEALAPSTAVLRPLRERGYLGVDLFFVLSGFILAYNYGDRRTAWKAHEVWRFWWMRLARIYPVHLCSLGVVVAGVVLAQAVGRRYGDPSAYDPAKLPAQLLLAHAWWAEAPSWNVPSWSVSAEWAGYLVFPALAPLAARLRAVTAIFAALLALVLAFAIIRFWGGTSLDLTTRLALVRFAGEFVAGVLLLRVHAASQRRARSPALALGLGALVVVFVVAGVPDEGVVVALAAMLVALAGDRGAVAAALGSRWAVAAGERSYTLYMTHGIVLHLFEALAAPETLREAPPVVRAAWLLGGVVALASAAEAAHRWVEVPGRRALQGFVEPRRRTTPTRGSDVTLRRPGGAGETLDEAGRG